MLKEGDEIIVTKCLYNHLFRINEKITIIEILSRSRDGCLNSYRCTNGNSTWCLCDNEFKPTKKRKEKLERIL